MGSVKGQIAVITGGGSGVGAAVALALAGAGVDIHLVGRRLKKLESIAEQARRFGSEAICHSVDLDTLSGPVELGHQLMQKLPHLDLLIQSAGAYLSGPIEQANLSDFDSQYRTNVRAPYALVQSLLPMLKIRRGQIVFINSSSGTLAKANTAQYDSTKHALRAIADSLRAEVNSHGIRVLSVYLGRTATEMQERVRRTEGAPYHPELLLQPEDVASVILHSICLARTAEITDIHIRPMIKSY
jgi:NADP-dependent 3-hydroxy acid dehydrogenase YdfG